MVRFKKDGIVEPSISQFFGYYKKAGSKEQVPMEQLEGYEEDRLGLKTMKEEGKLLFFTVGKKHLELDKEEFKVIIEVLTDYTDYTGSFGV